MNKIISFLKESNRWKHLVGGFLVGLCACSTFGAVYSAVIAASCLELKDKLLRYAKAAGITLISLHPVDGGSITDPELWSTRDAVSRKRYPEDSDRARADADQFAVYQEVFKGSGIDLIYIPYPYFGTTVTRSGISTLLGVKEDSPLVNRYLQKLLQWGKELHARLPKEIPVEILRAPCRRRILLHSHKLP